MMPDPTHGSSPAVAGSRGARGAVIANLPRNDAEVARRLQRRLSGFALVMGSVCRDVETLQRMASTLAAGFALDAAERRELDSMALRLFDAREVLEGAQ